MKFMVHAKRHGEWFLVGTFFNDAAFSAIHCGLVSVCEDVQLCIVWDRSWRIANGFDPIG